MKNLEAKTAHGRLEVEDVPVGPPHFVTELIGQTEMAEGQIAHFEAQIEPIHDSGLTVEFLHNNRPLKQASRIHTLCDFGYVALDIGQLIESDAGTYTCKVKNKFGEATSSVTLSIAGQGTLDTSSVRPEGKIFKKNTDYGHTKAKSLILCCPNLNSNPKYIFGMWI